MNVAQPDPAPVRIPKPESLEAKFKLLQMLPYDRRVKRKHCLVYGFILDWYHSKYGDALASVRHIVGTVNERDPFERGLYAGDVHGALTDLVEWGYLEQEKGTGRRASRYIPVWSRSVRETPNTTDDEISVRETPNTSVRETPNTTGDSVRDSTNEDPSTPIRSQDPDTGVVEYDCATPTAPPGPGLEGRPGAGMAQDGFEELYRIYGVRKSKAAARLAYDKLAPDADLHARMVDAAKAWRRAANGIERMHLARWIREERYDEDPKGERKVKASKPVAPANHNHNPTPTLSPRLVEIVEADVETSGGDSCLNLRMNDGDEIAIYFESKKADRQAHGQWQLRRLCEAIGIEAHELDDVDILLFKPLLFTVNGDFLPAPAIEDEAARTGAEGNEPVAANDNRHDDSILVDDWVPPKRDRTAPRIPPHLRWPAIMESRPLKYSERSFAAALAHEDEDDEEDAA